MHSLVDLAAAGDGRGVAGVELDGPVEVGQGLGVPLPQPVDLTAAGDAPGVDGVKLYDTVEGRPALLLPLLPAPGLTAPGGDPGASRLGRASPAWTRHAHPGPAPH